MKPFKKILFLSAVVAGITFFWLVPGINKAGSVRYTRVYEDTDHQAPKLNQETSLRKSFAKVNSLDTAITKRKKVYKKQSIKSGAKLKEIDPSMFSRAIHFKEDMVIVKKDSSSDLLDIPDKVVLQINETDSLKRIQ